jgi:hypothetical protein
MIERRFCVSRAYDSYSRDLFQKIDWGKDNEGSSRKINRITRHDGVQTIDKRAG